MSTRQDVASDGDGRYMIELVEALQLPPGTNEFAFPVSFEASVDAQWNLREFRIRDASLAARFYAILTSAGSPSGSTSGSTLGSVVVAGISCETMVLRRHAPLGERPGHYELAVDPATGFVLSMKEYDGNGRILQGFVYEDFAYGADLSGMPLRDGGRFVAQELDLDQPLAPQTGFRPLVPDVFPDGFEVLGGARFEIPEAAASGPGAIPDPEESFLPSGPWVRFDATDGIEILRFAHGLTDRVDGPNEPKSSVLRVLNEGTWGVAFAKVRGVSIVVTGRVDIDRMRRVVESAF